MAFLIVKSVIFNPFFTSVHCKGMETGAPGFGPDGIRSCQCGLWPVLQKIEVDLSSSLTGQSLNAGDTG
jgi:hypothetical protein